MTTSIAKIENPQSNALALPESQQEFLLANTVSKCLRKFRTVTTPALAIKSETPTLGTLKKTYSEDFMLAYIELWLTNLNDFINVSRKMKPEQMEELAFLIYQDYYYFNLADINLVFTKIKKGEFGQLFESVDGVKILSYFKKYEGERIQTAYEEGMKEHQELKTEDPAKRIRKSVQIKQAMKKARGFELHRKANN